MKKLLLLPVLFLLFSLQGFTQLLSWTPDFATESSNPFKITMDASKGNQQLFFYTPTDDIYVHIGVITNKSTSSSDWRYTKFEWGKKLAAAQAVYLNNNKWSYTITGGLRAYFGITDATEKIEKIAILFRNGAGSKVQRNADGSDMFIPIYTDGALAVRFVAPLFQPTYKPTPEIITKNIGNTITVTANSSQAATLNLYLNGSLIQTASAATTISATPTLTVSGNQQVIAEAINGGETKRDTLNFYVTKPITVAALPNGAVNGINYNPDGTSVTLVLYAPSKSRVNVIGDLPNSNWIEQADYQMNRTPDGKQWWLTINGLTPGTEYSYQYLVDGKLVIADPYAEKILDPWNDKYILPTTYPNLKPYPANLTSGIVSILQTSKPAYTWTASNYQRPDKRNLVIYELLVRDFIANHDWNTLKDTLNYLKNLGINAIELMPLNEFEGNESWGYNPDFYFAPDKYYGPENTLKAFIDECHKNGIAVIMDIALNHSFGLSPMVQLYWDANNNRPASNNPWFNAVPKHPFNVGYDLNHDKPETKYYVSRIVEHWLKEYKIDGFRFDLSKGFTQKQTCDNNGNNCDVGAWGAYDAGRIAIWKAYYDTVQLKSPSSYCILEHFADNSEEMELSNYGMLLWGNSNHTYSQASMGWQSESDFSYGFANVRNWQNPYLVNYMESHDEERIMTNNLLYGNASGSYSVKDLNTALKRQELTAAFFFTIPGPKMLWQFGEVGYDFSINYCEDGTISSNCRLDNKPIRWDYFQNANRKQLYDVYSKLIKLRFNPLFKDVFVTNITNQNLGGYFKSIVLSANSAKIVVIGNFDVAQQTGSVTFPTAGVWYDYLNNTTITATGNSQSFTLQAGEYHVYTNIDGAVPVTILSFEGRKISHSNVLTWKVADEVNLAYYELERSNNGQDFSIISTTNAAGSSKYSYTDNNAPTSGTVYYRLKSVDIDGKFQYSSIVKIQRNTTAWQVQATPNPFVNTLKIKLESPVQDKVKMIITDMSGRQLYNKSTSINTGTNWIEMNETSKFSKGTYLLSVISSNQTETIKVIKAN